MSALDLRTLQAEVGEWAQRNFPGFEPWMPLLGVMEELGELTHGFLKRAQGIRTNENHDQQIVDAVGDLVIFLANFCQANGVDLQQAVEKTWHEVKQRDWIENTATGQQATMPSCKKNSS